MKNQFLLKLISSIPVILIFLYFIPFLGVCLILFRYFVLQDQKKRTRTPLILLGVGVIVLIPQIVASLLFMFNVSNESFSWLFQIVQSEIYSVNFLNYSKFLIILGVVFFIVFYVFRVAFTKLGNFIRSYITSIEKNNATISSKNDLIMKEKREKAKHTHTVICPYCGADNILTSNIGTCQFCRREIGKK